MDPRDKSKQEKSKPDGARDHSPPAGPVKPPAKVATTRPSAPTDPEDSIPPGYIKRDERGNAVWDWRSPVDSTSSLLKKLEVPHLDVEDKKGEEPGGIKPARDSGGGYDPYNQSIKPRRFPPRKG